MGAGLLWVVVVGGWWVGFCLVVVVVIDRHCFMYNDESLELTAPQHTAVKT
jgi:hypothetical protein